MNELIMNTAHHKLIKCVVFFAPLRLCVSLILFSSQAQAQQNPSPMVEHTREHPRLKEERPPGKRIPLKVGTLFLPEKLPDDAQLFLHFHGSPWIAEVAAARNKMAVITLQLGSGSSVYAKPFADANMFNSLLQETEAKAERQFKRVGLTAWSAGYGSVRAILKTPVYYDRVQFVLLLDGLHAGYVSGKPGPKESELVADDLAIFIKLTKDAIAGKK